MCLHGEITISRRWARKALLGYFALCDINVLFHGRLNNMRAGSNKNVTIKMEVIKMLAN